mgnify:CR=1 FL=1
MKEILLLDADGVVFPGGKYFSLRYSEDFGVPIEKIIPFFKNEFRECQLGTKDLKETLEKYLVDWQWKGSVDELLQYWFEDRSVPDVDIMKIVQCVQNKGAQCYLTTDQEEYRAGYLWKTLGLSNNFDGSFFSCHLGARKKDPLFWEKVLTSLGNPDPSTVTFWDDEEENVATAKAAGIDAHFFTNFEDFKQSVQAL